MANGRTAHEHDGSVSTSLAWLHRMIICVSLEMKYENVVFVKTHFSYLCDGSLRLKAHYLICYQMPHDYFIFKNSTLMINRLKMCALNIFLFLRMKRMVFSFTFSFRSVPYCCAVEFAWNIKRSYPISSPLDPAHISLSLFPFSTVSSI